MSVKLLEVGPRDGLQNESTHFTVQQRADFVRALLQTGLDTVEAGSFVSPKAVPAMADATSLAAELSDVAPQCQYLVPNARGLDDALSAGAQRIAVFTAASDTFVQKNIGCSLSDSLSRFTPIVQKAKDAGVFVRGYVSCMAGCPYEGEVAIGQVVDVTRALDAMGCDDISLGDTIGVGTPKIVADCIRAIYADTDASNLSIHCHDTYGQALANVVTALELGIQGIDASLGGLGGCPYAPGASGNLATEDVLYCLQGLGVEMDIDLDALCALSHQIFEPLGRPSGSKVATAWRAKSKQ